MLLILIARLHVTVNSCSILVITHFHSNLYKYMIKTYIVQKRSLYLQLRVNVSTMCICQM